jgi:uncharacterized membrane protein YdfJ with MMPL/SSD domain
MFFFIGKAVTRLWPVILLGWVGLLAACLYTAPPWDKVVLHGESGLLPADVPSRKAEELLDREFPNQRHRSSIVLVVHRDDQPARSPPSWPGRWSS